MQCPDKIDIPVEHTFSGGVYIRQIMIPKGAVIMGKRHRKATCNMLLKGKLSVYVDETRPPEIIEAPAIFTSKPFAKKFALCLEEAIFANVLPTNLEDPEEIERVFIIPEKEYLELKEGEQCLLSQ